MITCNLCNKQIQNASAMRLHTESHERRLESSEKAPSGSTNNKDSHHYIAEINQPEKDDWLAFFWD